MGLKTEQIGKLAEYIVATDLSRPVKGGGDRVLFRMTHLGDAYPTIDFLVDILGPGSETRGFFFVQVKGTAQQGAPEGRLRVAIRPDRFNQMVAVPAPTYLIGVDVRSENSYIVAAHRRRSSRVSSITREYPLRSDAVRAGLYQEVDSFWRASRHALRHTRFRDV
ncbi:MAG TPA: DUF4365 domain-containing protein [Longimicrobium sp.]|nr:DUF4365 domain-containing protein [Longimicrobium sp.]